MLYKYTVDHAKGARHVYRLFTLHSGSHLLEINEEAFLKKYTNKPVRTTSYALVGLVASSTLAVYGIVHVHQMMWKIFIIAVAYAWIFRAIIEIVDIGFALWALYHLNRALIQESHQLNRAFIQQSELCVLRFEALLQKEAEKS